MLTRTSRLKYYQTCLWINRLGFGVLASAFLRRAGVPPCPAAPASRSRDGPAGRLYFRYPDARDDRPSVRGRHGVSLASPRRAATAGSQGRRTFLLPASKLPE